MKTPKRTYLPPEMDACEVQLESPICGGSVVFGTVEAKIDINAQDVAEVTNNDFSGNQWVVERPESASSFD